MSPELSVSPDARAKALLRSNFDARVFNFGDYNILVGRGLGACDGRDYLIGYRPVPREILVCPYVPGLSEDEEQPAILQIAETDVTHVVADVAGASVGIITTRGETVEFRVDDVVPVHDDGPELALQQSDDVADFLDFMRIFEADVRQAQLDPAL
ncbi:hypothetical protein [Arthrobacter sp. UM1]|uniref:hypothetical protein n=1 Tax=Arthrobacter sp. UM1 TaxID=2766776 RepID=UPI001CF6A64F|nr:hypothetical protein [Arthrobacter sp. UM1]MCB4207278.1 hypothetical protein [Arthrobacter sp. UM1]